MVSTSPWGSRSLGTARHPLRAVRRNFRTPRDQRLQLAEEAGTVVAQILGDEVAGKLGLTRKGGFRLFAWFRNCSPPPFGKCRTSCTNCRRRVGAVMRRLSGATLRRPSRCGIAQMGDARRTFHGKSANFCSLAGALCVGLVGHRVEAALDPIGQRSDPWSVLDPRRMRIDGGVSANCFEHRDVEQVASRLTFTATHDPRGSGTSHTKFVPVWRLSNPLSHPRVPPRLPQRLWGLEFTGGPHSLFVFLSVYQTSGGLKPCAALAAPVAALTFGSPSAST